MIKPVHLRYRPCWEQSRRSQTAYRTTGLAVPDPEEQVEHIRRKPSATAHNTFSGPYFVFQFKHRSVVHSHGSLTRRSSSHGSNPHVSREEADSADRSVCGSDGNYRGDNSLPVRARRRFGVAGLRPGIGFRVTDLTGLVDFLAGQDKVGEAWRFQSRNAKLYIRAERIFMFRETYDDISLADWILQSRGDI